MTCYLTLSSKTTPGLLILIDFEKAFDSIFIYQVLKYFGFGENIIQWIKILNTNFHAAILQCGHLSQQFVVQRGCRQGDPVTIAFKLYRFLLKHFTNLVKGWSL